MRLCVCVCVCDLNAVMPLTMLILHPRAMNYPAKHPVSGTAIIPSNSVSGESERLPK